MKKAFINNEIDFVFIKFILILMKIKQQVTIVNKRVTLFDIKFNYLINFLILFLSF